MCKVRLTSVLIHKGGKEHGPSEPRCEHGASSGLDLEAALERALL